MILFPIALIWLIVGLVWIIRNSPGDLDEPGAGGEPRQFRPRGPRKPRNGRSRAPRRESARSR